MSSSKHTEGKLFQENGTARVELDGRKYDLAECYSPMARNKEKDGIEEAKANAARIVAAWNEYDYLKAENEKLRDILESNTETLFAIRLDLPDGTIGRAIVENQCTHNRTFYLTLKSNT